MKKVFKLKQKLILSVSTFVKTKKAFFAFIFLLKSVWPLHFTGPSNSQTHIKVRPYRRTNKNKNLYAAKRATLAIIDHVNSVSRFVDFWKILTTHYLTKDAQMGYFWAMAISENTTLKGETEVATLWATFGNIWVTFHSISWSHRLWIRKCRIDAEWTWKLFISRLIFPRHRSHHIPRIRLNKFKRSKSYRSLRS